MTQLIFHRRIREKKVLDRKNMRVILQNKPLIITLCAFGCIFFGFLSGIHPIFAAGFIAIPIIVLLVYNPTYAYYLFVASLPLYVVPIKELGASVPRVVGIVMFCVWAPYVFFTKKFKIFKWDAFLVLVLIFYSWIVLSAIWSYFPEIGYMIIRALGMLILSVIIAITLIDTKDKLQHVIMIIILTCTAAGIRSFNMSLAGEERAVGIEGFDQNEFAAMLLTPLMICVSLVNYHTSRWKIVTYLLFGLGCFLGSLSTVSRGFAISVMAAFLHLYNLEPKKKKMLALVFILFICTAPYFVQRYSDRMGSERFELSSTVEAPRGRFGIWLIGVEIFKNHPFTGVGIGGFTRAFNEELIKDPTRIGFYKYGRAAHNDYIRILAELGIFALMLWIAICVQVYKKGISALKILEDQKETYLAAVLRGCISGFTGLLVAAAFLGLYNSKYMWLLLTLFALFSNLAVKIKTEATSIKNNTLTEPQK